MSQPLFRGSGVALVTPMTPSGIDFPALERLIEWHIASGTDALVVCATSGEGATLTYAERVEIIDRTVRQVNGRIPVIVGTGSNNTASAVILSREACDAGADGVLVVTPYYNKATQRGLVRHFTAVADAIDRPLIVYNVPSRTGVSCTAETYAALARHPNIVGVKEASGDFALLQDTRNLCGDDFVIWSGNDEDTAAICMLGGAGVISVAANIIPRELHELTALCFADRLLEAGRAQLRLSPLIRALFCEVNPIPVKTAMARMGLCGDLLRLPLCEMGKKNRERLFAAMDTYGVTA
ncbi:4-hydroxy-tetrahydrodipicolinate synthase [Oscillibacter valericigenes]|nr:4-hydroxy-tetrahydrodipicolinate synthase [Oscillibacter valericigenes]